MSDEQHWDVTKNDDIDGAAGGGGGQGSKQHLAICIARGAGGRDEGACFVVYIDLFQECGGVPGAESCTRNFDLFFLFFMLHTHMIYGGYTLRLRSGQSFSYSFS